MWISRSENYFDMYDVDKAYWYKLASMHFSAAAGRWLQSVEKKVRAVSWSEFCSMLIECFGKEHHELLIRQLFHIKQLGTVAEYIEKFSELVDQLTAYETTIDPLYFVMHFVDGLKDELRQGVLLQRPRDVDIACVLALSQEEVAESAKKRDFRKPDPYFAPRITSRDDFPLSAPPREVTSQYHRISLMTGERLILLGIVHQMINLQP